MLTTARLAPSAIGVPRTDERAEIDRRPRVSRVRGVQGCDRASGPL